MAWDNHEQRILEQIVRFVNPDVDPPEGDRCPQYHPGHGYWQFHAHREMAYNDFGRVRAHDLEEMFAEAVSQILPHLELAKQPFGDIRGIEDDFAWRRMVVQGHQVLVSTRRRTDGWYDMCLTIFTKWIPGSDGPDIS